MTTIFFSQDIPLKCCTEKHIIETIEISLLVNKTASEGSRNNPKQSQAVSDNMIFTI